MRFTSSPQPSVGIDIGGLLSWSVRCGEERTASMTTSADLKLTHPLTVQFSCDALGATGRLRAVLSFLEETFLKTVVCIDGIICITAC